MRLPPKNHQHHIRSPLLLLKPQPQLLRRFLDHLIKLSPFRDPALAIGLAFDADFDLHLVFAKGHDGAGEDLVVAGQKARRLPGVHHRPRAGSLAGAPRFRALLGRALSNWQLYREELDGLRGECRIYDYISTIRSR